MVSLWSLAVVAFERWLVVCKPLGNFAFKSSHALACCGLTWVCGLSAALPPLVGWSRWVNIDWAINNSFANIDVNGSLRANNICTHIPQWKIIVSLSRYIPEGMQCSCGPDWYTTGNKFNNETYVMFLFCFCFAVPFSTIVFCYSQLLFMLKSVGNMTLVSNCRILCLGRLCYV